MSFAKNTPSIETFPRRVGSADTMVGINMQLEASAPVEKLEWVNSLRIALPQPTEEDAATDGQPRIAVARIDLGGSFLSDADDAPRLVGSVSTARSAEWFIYSETPCAEELQRAISSQFPQLEIHAHAEHDPEWSVFREFLMPSPLERHLIETRRTYEGLRARGFRARRGFTIQHTVWFSSPEDRQDFADSLDPDDYNPHFPDLGEDPMEPIELPGVPSVCADVEDQYGVLLEQHLGFELEQLDKATQFMYRRAMSFGGEYEGWYTPDDRGH